MRYPHLAGYARRILSLDPCFHYAQLFIGGALGFNLNRTAEAMDVLESASAADPTFWRYKYYIGAVAYRKSREMDKAIRSLEEVRRYEDCPSMLKNILANLYLKNGQVLKAAEVFLDLAEHSRDQNYRELAVRKLADIEKSLRNRRQRPR
jgi:tetratricopeptide (TPR) repeat protein